MTFARKKHPALPQDESGWFLYQTTTGRGNSKRRTWKAGYHGKLHPHRWKNHFTEAEAIKWVTDLHAEFTASAQGHDV